MSDRTERSPRPGALLEVPVLVSVPPRFPSFATLGTMSPSRSTIGRYDCQSPEFPGTNGMSPVSALAAPALSPRAAKPSAPDIAPAMASLFRVVFMLRLLCYVGVLWYLSRIPD